MLVCGLAGVGAGCGAEPVEARAIWVDDISGAGEERRTIHVYDRGELDSFEVVGVREPVQRVRLDPRGAGVLVRAGDRRGAWFDLDDGRRLPLLLPPAGIAGQATVGFAGDALTWIDDVDGALELVPLTPGLELERRVDGTMIPLARGSGFAWVRAAEDAPILFVGGRGGGRASFVRYPDAVDAPLVLALEAEAEGLSLPSTPSEARTCTTSLGCFTQLAIEPSGELAAFASDPAGPWQLFERRAPAAAGPWVLPDSLTEVAEGAGLRLLALLDLDRSVWLGAGQLYTLDRRTGAVDNLPLFASPPLHWTLADRGRAVLLVSSSGPVYRIDQTGIRALALETTDCPGPGDPVVSPGGRWIAWTCVDPGAELAATSGVVVRVSAAGLERFVGVPMATLAIDDDGDLLLYSVESSLVDQVDGVGPASVPRNLFSLARDGVLTRIDELEPAPAPVLLGSGEQGSYIQGVALPG